MSCIRIITFILLTLGLCACNGEVTADVPSETVSSAETREAEVSSATTASENRPDTFPASPIPAVR